MGQYHIPVNLDKGESLNPHYLGSGLKLWEQLANNPGTNAALVILLASASNGAGGGDLKGDSDIIGRWRGDRIAFVGDYDDHSEYDTPFGKLSGADIYDDERFTDISEKVAAVIEENLGGKYSGDGWRDWSRDE